MDGFNVVHASFFADGDRSEWWAAPKRERLVGLAQRFADPAARIWIVFDGPRPPDDPAAASERVQVVFAASADEWIVKRVRRSEEPGRLAVVTGDRKIADRARHRGAQVTGPRDFIAMCAVPEELE